MSEHEISGMIQRTVDHDETLRAIYVCVHNTPYWSSTAHDKIDCIFVVVVVITSFIHLLLLHLLANNSLTSHYARFFARAFNSRDE